MTKRVWTIGFLVLAELVGLAFAYQVFSDFSCSATDSEAACRFIRSLVGRAIVVLPALGLFIALRHRSRVRHSGSPSASGITLSWQRGPGSTVATTADVGPMRVGPGQFWLALHLLGLAILLQPLFLVSAVHPQVFFERSIGPWILGSTLAIFGALAWVAPLAEWKRWASRDGYALLAIGGAAFFVPDLATLVEPLWYWQVLTASTFAVATKLLLLVGTETYADAASYVIGLDDFYVRVAHQCSGIEGFALIASFVALYGLLFRKDLRLSRYWLVVLPLALVASWILNAFRIFALIVIGAWYSPAIAVNGFHSYAGWMLFTGLAVAIICLVHGTRALRRTPAPQSLGLRDDWLAARILPFSVFLVTGIVGAAFTADAELAAPYRAIFLALALAFFWPHRHRIAGSWSLEALASGALVGLVWIATAPTASNSQLIRDVLGDYGPIALGVWVLLRILLTTILVPVAEELFFRGYLLGRLDFGGPAGRFFSILVSSGLFALLHNRWMEAWAAGIVFALVMLRRNRLGDAIVAHVTANSLIALSAGLRGDWTII